MREISDDEFVEAVDEGKVLVDFYSTFCPPCKALAPILEAMEQKNPQISFVKINVDEHMLHASRNGVSSLPALILFEGGQETKRHVGLMPAPAMAAWLGV